MSYEWRAVRDDDAPFAPRDGGGAIVFAGKMWLLGGWNPLPQYKEFFPRVCNGEIWCSADGSMWELVGHAPWEGRHCAGTVVHAGRMWVVGGDINQGHYQHDVWSSTNGLDWTCVCEEPPWGTPLGGRFSHYTVAFADHIWVIGGQNMAGMSSEYHSHSFQLPDGETILHDDVWRTKDGRHWEQVADRCPWAPRSAVGGSAVMGGKMWLVGGGTYDTPGRPERLFYNDVWNSPDGVIWTCVSAHCLWEARQYHEIAVWDVTISMRRSPTRSALRT